MPEGRCLFYLSCLPTLSTVYKDVISLRLGTLIISVYSVLHSLLAGYNFEYLKRRELEVNLNGIFFTAFAVFSLVLLYAVLLERQQLVLLWLWYTVIMIIPMLIVLVAVTNVHNKLKNGYCGRNAFSCILHLPLFFAIIVVHSYRQEIELLDDAKSEINSN